MKDEEGRVMERIYPTLTRKRVPNKNRHPIKRKPVKKKEFTDQFKFEAVLPVTKASLQKPTFTDLNTIERMKEMQRWPVPEMLIGRPQRGNYCMKIDSIIAEVYSAEYIVEW